MSLINQMLKDLEKRSNPTAIRSKMTLSGLTIARKPNIKKNVTRAVIMGVGCFTILILFLFIRHHPTRLGTLPPTTVSHLSVKTNTAEMVAQVDPVTPIFLTGITLQTHDNMTYLRFLLSQHALYRLTTHQKTQVLTIILEHTQLITSLPPINPMSAIQYIDMTNQKNGDLKISMTLKADSEVQYVNLDNTGKWPELQLSVFHQNRVSADARTAVDLKAMPLKKLAADSNAEQQYQRALSFLTIGENKQAQSLLTELVVKFPDFQLAREALVGLLLQQKNINKADKVLEIGLQQQPDCIPFIELKARILVEQNQINDALELLQRSAPPLAKNPDYHAFIAALYQQAGQSALAEQLYEQLLTLQPSRAVWWSGLGIALESTGKHEEALQAYARAKNGNGLNPELRAYLEAQTADRVSE